MILTRSEILRRREARDIVIDPWDPEALNPNSYNLRLSPRLLGYLTELSMADVDPEPDFSVQIGRDGYVLQPGILYLGATLEHTESRGLVPMLEGRSGVGRLGISVHVTAGVGDVGFCGSWTLELAVVRPVRVFAGVQICQILWHDISGSRDDAYLGHYRGQSAGVPVPSRLGRELRERGFFDAQGRQVGAAGEAEA